MNQSPFFYGFMANIIKHDVLSYNRSTVHIIGATINIGAKVIVCGHFFINSCDEKEIILDSGTGDRYLAEIPQEYLGVRESSQFNVTIPLIKLLNQ